MPRSSAPAVALSASGYGLCELRADGHVRCAGQNEFGEVGDGTLEARRQWTPVRGIDSAVQITSGFEHVCVLLADHTARCWGANPFGQLADGTDDNRTTPVPVKDADGAVLRGIEEIAAGVYQTCARTQDEILCWGGNLGGMPVRTDPKTSFRLRARAVLPKGVARGSTFSRSHALGHERSYASTRSGWLTWGTSLEAASRPKPVRGIDDAVDLVSGFYHECILSNEGAVRCWGANTHGQLGADTAYEPQLAKPVPDLPHATSVVVGADHTCALTDDGGLVYCWGDHEHGQLGDVKEKEGAGRSYVPGISGAVELTAGRYFTCARLADQSVRCWGEVPFARNLPP
jgi:alpha-tubulin suppressor-like RCC1 family protein